MASGEKAADCDYLRRIEIDSTLTRTFEIEICKYMDGQETASPHVRRFDIWEQVLFSRPVECCESVAGCVRLPVIIAVTRPRH